MAINPKELIEALALVLKEDGKPVEIVRLAVACRTSESEVWRALFAAKKIGAVITYRYPPFPCAAVTAVSWKSWENPFGE